VRESECGRFIEGEADSSLQPIERWWSAQGRSSLRKEKERRSVGNLSSLASYYILDIPVDNYKVSVSMKWLVGMYSPSVCWQATEGTMVLGTLL